MGKNKERNITSVVWASNGFEAIRYALVRGKEIRESLQIIQILGRI